MNSDDTYRLYRKAIDAFKVELGYQDVRKQILSKTLPEGIYVMDTPFQTKCRKKDREFFQYEWLPQVLKALETHTHVVGTITCLPKTEGGEGHYMCIMFRKGRYPSDRVAYLFDPSDAQKNSVCVYSTQLVKQQLKSMLDYWHFTLNEMKTNYTCQMILYDTNKQPIHVDTYCQTWSLLLLIHFFKIHTFEKLLAFGNDDHISLKHRHDIFIKMVREDILPNIDNKKLEKTFQELIVWDGIKKEISAYDILMGTVIPDKSYLFFRDVPY